MKKLVIELCCVIVLAACGNGKEQNTVEEDSTAKALLQGVWIDDETELPLMRIEGDTIYYADPQNIPVSFKIIRDTIYVYGSNTVTYKIDRQTEYSFWFHSLADEIETKSCTNRKVPKMRLPLRTGKWKSYPLRK